MARVDEFYVSHSTPEETRLSLPRLVCQTSAQHFQCPNILSLCSAKDATEAFEDVGHSDEARALLKDLYVGEFEKDGVRVFCFVINRNHGSLMSLSRS